MLVSSSPIQAFITAAAAGAGQGDTPGRAQRQAGNVAAPAVAASVVEGEAASPAVPSGDSVSLSLRDAKTGPDRPAPVYAEVWKDGLKVAEVDSHGSVSASSGLIRLPTGGGSGGAWLAAARAAQIAQAVGGEIRVAGQTMDGQTLAMRVKLQTAYGL